ncbi:hypothetical protein KXR53_28460 [Inquilinus limosus]|uniref:hypothetical protein n=1 Tax=Inquilinus limosus TaxID=171674 RepID=UPI003F153961
MTRRLRIAVALLCLAGAHPAEAGGAKPGPNSCRWAEDRSCDEPDIGTGVCAGGSDGRRSVYLAVDSRAFEKAVAKYVATHGG